jgi:hypothetical protein
MHEVPSRIYNSDRERPFVLRASASVAATAFFA